MSETLSHAPQVTAIITTFRRPNLVGRAIESVLKQSFGALELVVVMDGPDKETEQAIAQFSDPRLRVIALDSNRGQAAALNKGIQIAQADWVAFLDDDDEWLPEKLERQMEMARTSPHKNPVIASRFIARYHFGDLVWPRRLPGKNEVLVEYLLCQNGLRGGEAGILPSVTLTNTSLAREIPFREIKRHVDIDWLMRVARVEGFGVHFVDVPLAIWHLSGHVRVSSAKDWRYSLNWAKQNRAWLTRRAFAAFLMTAVSEIAVTTRECKAFFQLIGEAYRHGQPSLMNWIAHLCIWLIPFGWRRNLNRLIGRWIERKKHDNSRI